MTLLLGRPLPIHAMSKTYRLPALLLSISLLSLGFSGALLSETFFSIAPSRWSALQLGARQAPKTENVPNHLRYRVRLDVHPPSLSLNCRISLCIEHFAQHVSHVGSRPGNKDKGALILPSLLMRPLSRSNNTSCEGCKLTADMANSSSRSPRQMATTDAAIAAPHLLNGFVHYSQSPLQSSTHSFSSHATRPSPRLGSPQTASRPMPAPTNKQHSTERNS